MKKLVFIDERGQKCRVRAGNFNRFQDNYNDVFYVVWHDGKYIVLTAGWCFTDGNIYKQQMLNYKGHNKREVADDYIQFANYISGSNNILNLFNVISGGK